MIAIEVDYKRHYDEFVRRHMSDTSLRMMHYCKEVGIRHQQMYKWLSRKGISLKRVYAEIAYGQFPACSTPTVPATSVAFLPLEMCPPPPVAPVSDTDLGMVRIELPNGVCIEIERCRLGDLMALTGGPLSGCHV